MNVTFASCFRHVSLLVATILFATSCGDGGSDQSDAEDVAVCFGKAYFNYEFKNASQYCTPESERWLKFAASNVTEKDVEVLRGMDTGAEVESSDVNYADDDSTATVCVTVHDVMMRDTIGGDGHVVDEAHYIIPLVKQGDIWLVKMEGLLRNGM